MLSKNDIQNQSKRAYGQWAKQWRENAKTHSKYPMKSFADFEGYGVGRSILCIGNGYSFEEEIETIKAHADKVDIICCDKSLGHLLNNGIKPTFCMVMDANVSYEKYLKPWEDQVQDTILIGNACGNPLWAEKGKWKDRFFFVVMDVLRSEKEFCAISNCPNTMAAGTNVGNALIIAVTQCDNRSRKNLFAYDKILLIGFDFCWGSDGKYYAFDEKGGGKYHYMRHLWLVDNRGEYAWTSGNLLFSAKWLADYVNGFQLPVVQCTKRTVFSGRNRGILAEQMQYRFRPEDRDQIRRLNQLRNFAIEQKKSCEAQLTQMAKEHHYSYLKSL